MIQPVEQWRDIANQPGWQVSDLGRIQRIVDGVAMIVDLHSTPPYGYVFVTIKKKSYAVHRLVLEAFVGPCPPGMEARHILVRDVTDNRLVNLAWGTRFENAQDRKRHLVEFGSPPPLMNDTHRHELKFRKSLMDTMKHQASSLGLSLAAYIRMVVVEDIDRRKKQSKS